MILMFQHFVLYRKNDELVKERSILLHESRSLTIDKHRSFDGFYEPPMVYKDKKLLKYSV